VASVLKPMYLPVLLNNWNRLVALALSLGLALGLGACGSWDSDLDLRKAPAVHFVLVDKPDSTTALLFMLLRENNVLSMTELATNGATHIVEDAELVYGYLPGDTILHAWRKFDGSVREKVFFPCPILNVCEVDNALFIKTQSDTCNQDFWLKYTKTGYELTPFAHNVRTSPGPAAFLDQNIYLPYYDSIVVVSRHTSQVVHKMKVQDTISGIYRTNQFSVLAYLPPTTPNTLRVQGVFVYEDVPRGVSTLNFPRIAHTPFSVRAYDEMVVNDLAQRADGVLVWQGRPPQRLLLPAGPVSSFGVDFKMANLVYTRGDSLVVWNMWRGERLQTRLYPGGDVGFRIRQMITFYR
jgi:hypothetical protein